MILKPGHIRDRVSLAVEQTFCRNKIKKMVEINMKY
jgi:hypothetical protein